MSSRRASGFRSDQRQLSLELEAFLDAGEAPVYFGFGSMRAPQDVSQAMIKAARAVGRRAIVSRGWAGVTLPDDEPGCLSIGEAVSYTHLTLPTN